MGTINRINQLQISHNIKQHVRSPHKFSEVMIRALNHQMLAMTRKNLLFFMPDNAGKLFPGNPLDTPPPSIFTRPFLKLVSLL